MMEGADDLMQEDRRIGVGGWLLAAAGAASVIAVLIASFATNAHAQAGAGGPIPNVVGSQYLSTPNNVADKQLVPIRVLPDGTVVVSTGGGSSGGTVQPIAGTTGGASTYFVQPTASDNHVVIKAGAGTVYGVTVFNNSATINYLRFYDATTGFNGCNSATGLVTQIQIPASTSVGGAVIPLPVGAAFATGISACITSGYATNDTTNATATAMSVSVFYK